MRVYMKVTSKVIIGLFMATSMSLANAEGVFAKSDYEVIMPEDFLMRSSDLKTYSQQIRDLNQPIIDKLPEDERQDATRNVLEVIADLNREEIDAITEMKKDSLVPNSVNYTARADWTNYGDILISMDKTFSWRWPKTGGVYVEWNHGHAGIADFTTNYVIEVHPDFGVASKNRYKSFWAKYNTDELYVGGATQAKYKTAVNYARQQIGKPYAIKTTLSSTNAWYCSKLVYKAWLAAGYNVGNAKTSFPIPSGIVGVTPYQILWDDNVFFYQKVK